MQTKVERLKKRKKMNLIICHIDTIYFTVLLSGSVFACMLQTACFVYTHVYILITLLTLEVCTV